ncbi:MAG: flagellar hook-length control protein FliK [Desulfuromonadales bacterium]|nr:flagellar hook-length control protein FliK [Desulfuromonadales bacterium]MDW7757267.1 flagellar hook-length control protein FliK [Desulfuromonadales bacterium]
MMNMMPMATMTSQPMPGRTGGGKGPPAGDFLPFLQQAPGEGLAWNGNDASQDLLAAMLAASLGMVPTPGSSEVLLPTQQQGNLPIGDGSMRPGQNVLAMDCSQQQNPFVFSGQELKAADAEGTSQGKGAVMAGADLSNQEADFDLRSFMAKAEGKSAEATGGEGKGAAPLSDSRFAEILGSKPVELKYETGGTSKDSAGNPALRLAQNSQIEEAAAEPTLSLDVAADESGEVPELSLDHKSTATGEIDGFTHKGQDSLLADTGRPQQAPVTGSEAKSPEIRLNSGAVINENRIVEQTIDKFAVNQAKETGSVTLRLHPEELGQVKVELVMDKDSVRAHLHAQSQQVQEVLERHLPRLRDALEQQGLKIDQLQVSVDSQHNGNRETFQQHEQQRFAGFQKMPASLAGYKGEPVAASTTQAPTRQGSGLSLRI